MEMFKNKEFVIRRTDSAMLSRQPFKIFLGTQDWTIPVLNNRKAAQWRAKLWELLGPLVANIDFGIIDLNAAREEVSQKMSEGLSAQMIRFPEAMIELIYAYAGEALPHELIYADDSPVTDEQITLAFAEISEIAYPFFFHLWATKRALAIPAQKIIRDMQEKMETPPAGPVQ